MPLGSTFAGTPPGVNTTSFTGLPEITTSRPPTWNEPISFSAIGACAQAPSAATAQHARYNGVRFMGSSPQWIYKGLRRRIPSPVTSHRSPMSSLPGAQERHSVHRAHRELPDRALVQNVQGYRCPGLTARPQPLIELALAPD